MPDGDPTPSPTPAPAGSLPLGTRPPTPAEIRQYLSDQPDHSRFQIAQELFTQLHQAQARIAELEPRATAAADAERALADYRALGTPEEIRGAVTERDGLKAKDAQRARAEDIQAKAAAAGYAPKIVERLSRDPDAAFDVAEVKDEERDGKPAKVLYVKRAGVENAEAVDLDAYAAEHFPEFAPTLRANGATPPPAPTPRGPVYPPADRPRNGGGGPTDADLVAEKSRSGAYAI